MRGFADHHREFIGLSNFYQFTTWAMPVIIGWEFAGFNLAIFLSGLYSIPNETIEVIIIDGASYRQRLWHVIFPQMKDSFFIATIMCVTGSYQIFDQAVALGALGGNKNVEFVAVACYSNRMRKIMKIQELFITSVKGISLYL